MEYNSVKFVTQKFFFCYTKVPLLWIWSSSIYEICPLCRFKKNCFLPERRWPVKSEDGVVEGQEEQGRHWTLSRVEGGNVNVLVAREGGKTERLPEKKFPNNKATMTAKSSNHFYTIEVRREAAIGVKIGLVRFLSKLKF